MESTERNEHSCIICGGNEFGPAYGGRSGANGNFPCCAGCGSVERHRIVFNLYEEIQSIAKNANVLQFAPDCAVKKSSFKSYVGSTYGGENSMDIKNTGLESASLDIVLSNHVFEHIDDDIAALNECLRIVGEEGFVHICVPSPSYFTTTVDWGYADKNKAFHYRHYGSDMGADLCREVDGLHCLAIVGEDKVTEAQDIIFFFSKSKQTLIEIAKIQQKTRFVCVFVA